MTVTPHTPTSVPLRYGLAAALLVAAAASCGGATDTETSASAASSQSSSQSSPSPSSSSSQSSEDTPGMNEPLTMAAVEAHNTPQSCWAVIEGDVYDLTTWISAHPGGPDKISALCGTDATAQFTGKHGAVDDDGKPQTRLETFKLGPLQT